MVAPVVQPRAQPHMHAAAVALIRVVAVAAGGEAELAVEFSPRKGGGEKAMRGAGAQARTGWIQLPRGRG